MSETALETLGITKEELQERVIDRIVDELCYKTAGFDEDIRNGVEEKTTTAINDSITKIHEEYVFPGLEKHIESVSFHQTNRYGEPKQDPLTFKEYLAQKAEGYLNEKVNWQGQTRDEDSYNWRAKQTRIAYLVHEHIEHRIQKAIEKALKSINEGIADGLAETVKMKLAEALNKLDVNVKV